MLTIDSIDMTIMHKGSCRRSWAVRGLELRYFCSKIILGVNSKRNIIYSRSSSESTYCILFYPMVHRCRSWIFWIFWSCSSEVSPSFWADEGTITGFTEIIRFLRFLRCRFAWSTQLTQRLCLVPWREVWRKAAEHWLTCWPCFRQFSFGAAGGHLCACDGCMTQVMAAESTCLHQETQTTLTQCLECELSEAKKEWQYDDIVSMILSINCMQTDRNKSCMWDRPRPSNFNILHIPAPCDRVAWRRLCPVCRTEASSTMRIFRPWCDSRRWQRDAAFWHSHCILLGICQNSATRTVRRCLKDAVSSGPWTFYVLLTYFTMLDTFWI